jgi:hypothetical protein
MTRSIGFTFASALDLNMGHDHIKLDTDSQKLYNFIPMTHGKIHIQTLTHGYEYCLIFFPDVFQNVMYKVIQDMEYIKTYLDDLLILINRNKNFKDHLLKLKMVLTRLLTAGTRLNMLSSPNLSSLQNK